MTAHVDRPYTLLETEQGFEFVDSRSGLRRLFDFDGVGFERSSTGTATV